MAALSSRRPGNRYRTSRIATPTPNTVLISTEITATKAPSFAAAIRSGSCNASSTGCRPWANVLLVTESTGSATSTRT